MKTKIPGPMKTPYPGGDPEQTFVDAPDSFRVNFQAEAVLLKALRHPNVVSCYGSVILDTPTEAEAATEVQLMFLQEYCADGTLLDMLKSPKSYGPLEALRWVRDVARGMEYLHSSGIQIAHRDLKPENILLSGNVAKVADFGLSRLVLSGDELRDPSIGMRRASTGSSPLSRQEGGPPAAVAKDLMKRIPESRPPSAGPAPIASHEQAVSEQAVSEARTYKASFTGKTGSCRYMAPEVWAARTYDHRADLFSFAVLAYELLARRRAYADKYMTMEQVAAAVEKNPEFRPTLPKSWPKPLVELMSSCWAAVPSERPTFWEVARKLDLLVRAVEAAQGARPECDDEELVLGASLIGALSAPRLISSSCCTLQ